MSKLSLGRLVDIDWKVGVSLQSSKCKSLNAPYISIVLRIKNDRNGDISCYPLELSIQEFQEFSASFHSINAVMNSI